MLITSKHVVRLNKGYSCKWRFLYGGDYGDDEGNSTFGADEAHSIATLYPMLSDDRLTVSLHATSMTRLALA